MENKVPLKEWTDKLSKYYSLGRIRRLHYEHKGSIRELANILIKEMNEHRRHSVIGRIKDRKYATIASSMDDHSYFTNKRTKRAYKKIKSENKNGTITIYMEELKFNYFFDNDVPQYFTDKGIKKETFAELEIILKNYYDEWSKIEQLKKLIKKDSISQREEEIKKILEQTNQILQILESDLYNTLPKEIKIKTIGELNRETENKLKELNLQTAYPYSKLLKFLRNI